MASPIRRPTALKILEGNPGHQKLEHNEPRPRPIAPPCPDWLDRRAKAEWRRICPELERLGLLTGVDQAGLANYCSLVATIAITELLLRKTGLTMELREPSTKDADGNVVLGAVKYVQQRPEVAIRHKAILGIRAYLAEFGLTPAARGKMSILGGVGATPDEDESAFDL